MHCGSFLSYANAGIVCHTPGNGLATWPGVAGRKDQLPAVILLKPRSTQGWPLLEDDDCAGRRRDYDGVAVGEVLDTIDSEGFVPNRYVTQVFVHVF